MRNIILILMLCFAAMATTALATDELSVMTCKQLPQDFAVISHSLDEQPDTIAYDDGNLGGLITNPNYWVRVRFTAPANFDLHEVYLALIDGDIGTQACNIYVYGPNGPVQGQSLATASLPVPMAEGWNQATLSSVVNIDSGTDFYVVFGPVPGGGENTNGYKPLHDSGTTSNRSQICLTNNQFGTYQNNPFGDDGVRAGGVIESFTDIMANDCFCITAEGDTSFNMLAGDQLFFHTYLQNAGTADIAAYDVTWTVEGPDQSVVFTETVNATDLPSGSAAIIQSTTSLALVDDGVYNVTSVVTTNGDALLENNETLLRFYVGDTHRWFLYDDNGDPDSYSGFSEGNGWGMSFIPTSYPARVTSIRVAVSAAGTADFRIWMNSEDGSPTGAAVWSATPTVVAGWNEVAVTPPVDLFEGASFTVGHIYHSAAALNQGTDNDQPNQAGNLGMPIISWQPSNEGAEWFASVSGNNCIQAYIDSSTSVPPYPVIEVSVASLNFGNVLIGNPAPLSFWVYNRGNVQDLVISSFEFTPASFSAAYIFDQAAYTIAASDSQEVTLTFTPTVASNYSGRVKLMNNSNNNTEYQILLIGAGITEAVTDPATGLPTEFELSQNYPNPFNPTTDIQFALPHDADVSLTVINLLGQEVATVASGFQSAGFHTVSFNAVNLPSGLYFYKLDAGDFTAIRKMMLLK
jgi:hypothetical protein